MDRARLNELRGAFHKPLGLSLPAQAELLKAVANLQDKLRGLGEASEALNKAMLQDLRRITELRQALSQIAGYAGAKGSDGAWYEITALGALESDRPTDDEVDKGPRCCLCKTRWRKDEPDLLKTVYQCVKCKQVFCEECRAKPGLCVSCDERR